MDRFLSWTRSDGDLADGRWLQEGKCAESAAWVVSNDVLQYSKNQNRSFRTALGRTILAPSLIAEAKRLPENILSASEAFDDVSVPSGQPVHTDENRCCTSNTP
jgi:hypothetical protein